jgi:excisionase family DNA binding protein
MGRSIMTSSATSSAVPEGADAELARDALRRVRETLATYSDEMEPVRIQLDEEAEPVTVPRAAIELLARALNTMAAGQAVTLVADQAELSTTQAADVLGVSRPFLIGLLEAGQIAYRKVGTHRRVQADSLLDYQRRDDAQRRAAATELTQLSQEMGLY